MYEYLIAPWHWSVGGTAIALVMLLLIFSGQKFGVSSSFQDVCSMVGFGSKVSYFNYDWREKSWLILFVIGTIGGGYIASHFLMDDHALIVSDQTRLALEQVNISVPSEESFSSGFLPDELFGNERIFSFRFILVLLIGGFFIGFGTRYAGGCTSGHAITGLSNFQLPSFVAVIGFFAGGLLMTHLLLPSIFSWLF